MSAERQIGILGGGNMAEALLRGLLESGWARAQQLRVSDIDDARRSWLATQYGIATLADNVALARWANLLVLAVKPQKLETALGGCREATAGKLVISVAAGVPTARIEDLLAGRVVRAMPNTPALVLAGATAVAAGATATSADLATSVELFECVGETVVLDESLMDAVTGLSGSGPAYVMVVIEALADGGVKMGLPRDVALKLAAQTLLGSAQLLLAKGEHPARLKDAVTSPGGTTIHGLDALEAAGVRRGLIAAVEAATRRSRELGRR